MKIRIFIQVFSLNSQGYKDNYRGLAFLSKGVITRKKCSLLLLLIITLIIVDTRYCFFRLRQKR